ncbi:hypothetical protein BELL_0273g00040 [Botrytis elliptica]|uniref:GH16 domain-containing protein n=1 Tax=Botrytis elliptica TaxID=278938 RepID=A0A4Z1JZM8_9HELO|nr:hypothetical protein EAE99_007996 [Botrytis elliptica]TGO74543.1 hypothetical protein BELL_0273g00040 [Botrytis elliptica]
MIQRIVSTATLALAFIGEVSATNKYTLVDDYAGTNFFDMFDFYTGADPTTGFVSYTSKEVAGNANSELGVALTKVENGQAYMGVDYVNVVTTGRPSVRIQSKETYTHGLIIADLAHMPASICGTWPAFWTVNTTNYPQYGEIDILENINEKTVSLQTLHTEEGCYISGNQHSTQLKDNVTTYNCDDSATSSIFGAQDATSACSGTNSDPNSYGTTFNNNGGGVYAMQWTSDVIRMWNFGPDAIPADITAGTPDPSTWDLPAFTTEGGVCNIDGLFANHKIIFDTTFCGGYAGQTGFWQETTCYDAEKYPTCDSYVGANPEAYKEAYWLINSVKVYQNDTLAATSAAAASSTSAAIVASSTKISTTASPVISSTARAESLLGVATSEAASIVASSSLSSAACVSTGALLSGQTACPESPVKASSTASIIASVSSVATIIPTTAPVEASSTVNSIASVSPVQESSDPTILPSTSSIEQSSVDGVLTTTSVPYPHTTSTIYGTNTRTDELGSVVTETVILSTTICPITAAEGEATPSPSSANVDSTTTIQSTITSVKSAATIYSTVTLPGEVSSAIIVATSEIAQTTVPAAQPSSTEITVASSPIISSTSVLGVAVSSPIVENTSSAVVVLQTATVIPEAYTTQVSEAAYAWSTVTTEGTSTVVPVGSSPSVPASAESDSSVPTASAGASSGETTSVSSLACVPSGGALLSGQTACPETPAASTSALSGEITSIVSSVAIPTPAISSAACVASGALLSGETACPETPVKAVSSSVATSTQPSTTSVNNTPIPSDASVVLSTATVVPMQSAPAPAATSAEGIAVPQSSSVVAQAGTTSPIIFTPTYATTSFITKPTSASANATSTQTITSSSVSITGTGILIDTSTLGSIETFTFAMPSAYSATGTSDASAVTAYPYLDSGVSKVSVRGSIMAAMGAMALLLVV